MVGVPEEQLDRTRLRPLLDVRATRARRFEGAIRQAAIPGMAHPVRFFLSGPATPAFCPGVFHLRGLQFRHHRPLAVLGPPVGPRISLSLGYGGRLAEFLTRRKAFSLAPVGVLRGRPPP